MKISVITKPNMSLHATRKDVLEILSKEHVVCECENRREIAPDTDVVLVFGGDGTMLDAVRAVGGRNIAILGVNLGNLGFLTSFEQDADPKKIADTLIHGDTVSRMLLDVSINGAKQQNALNEVVIKTAGTRPITLDVSVDGSFADSFHSDGIIVSSPAGSTAYALSAGGPVLAPDVDAFEIIPICAHSMHSRPLVVSSSSCVKITLGGEHDAVVSIDGGNDGILKVGEAVTVSKSSQTAKFISAGNSSFYNKLLSKMNRWGTTSSK